MPDAKYGRLPFKEAIAFFKQKVKIPTEKWTDLMDGAHSRGFMVAGANKTELLTDIYSAVLKGLIKGTTLQEFRKDFDKAVNQYGWSYKGQRGWRTATIFNTNMRTSYAAGRYQQMQDPDVLEAFPYWRYRVMDHGKNRRPEHQMWDNTTLPANDPWWAGHKPPKGWG